MNKLLKKYRDNKPRGKGKVPTSVFYKPAKNKPRKFKGTKEEWEAEVEFNTDLWEKNIALLKKIDKQDVIVSSQKRRAKELDYAKLKAQRAVKTVQRNKMAMNNMEAARNIAIRVHHQADQLVQISLCESMIANGSEEQKTKARQILSNKFDDLLSRINEKNPEEELLFSSSSQEQGVEMTTPLANQTPSQVRITSSLKKRSLPSSTLNKSRVSEREVLRKKIGKKSKSVGIDLEQPNEPYNHHKEITLQDVLPGGEEEANTSEMLVDSELNIFTATHRSFVIPTNANTLYGSVDAAPREEFDLDEQYGQKEKSLPRKKKKTLK